MTFVVTALFFGKWRKM